MAHAIKRTSATAPNTWLHDARRQIVQLDGFGVTQHRSALDGILQFPHVARPIVSRERAHGLARHLKRLAGAGVNLVAKEFIACKTEGKGVLILSEMAGAADELAEAVEIAWRGGEHGFAGEVAADVLRESGGGFVAAGAVLFQALHDDPVEIAPQHPGQARRLGAPQRRHIEQRLLRLRQPRAA